MIGELTGTERLNWLVANPRSQLFQAEYTRVSHRRQFKDHAAIAVGWAARHTGMKKPAAIGRRARRGRDWSGLSLGNQTGFDGLDGHPKTLRAAIGQLDADLL